MGGPLLIPTYSSCSIQTRQRLVGLSGTGGDTDWLSSQLISVLALSYELSLGDRRLSLGDRS
ncbi:hypothetical protein LINPERHAP2_LOCUS32681 [Linum perenne]